MSKFIPGLVAAALALTTVACASSGAAYSTRSQLDNRKHFALKENLHQTSPADAATLQALYMGLKDHGYIPAQPDQADFLVSFHTLDVALPPHGLFINGYAGPGVYTDESLDRYYFPGNVRVYKVDSSAPPGNGKAHLFMVSVRDARSGKLLWLGWRPYPKAHALDASQSTQLVQQILSRLPSANLAT